MKRLKIMLVLLALSSLVTSCGGQSKSQGNGNSGGEGNSQTSGDQSGDNGSGQNNNNNNPAVTVPTVERGFLDVVF